MDIVPWFCIQVMVLSPGFCWWISLCFFLFYQCQILLQAPIRAVSNRTGTDHSNGIYFGSRASSTVSRMIKQWVAPTVSNLKGILIAASVCSWLKKKAHQYIYMYVVWVEIFILSNKMRSFTLAGILFQKLFISYHLYNCNVWRFFSLNIHTVTIY